MTEAEQAYAKAEQTIAEAIESGAKRLNFSGKDFRALAVLPPQIAKAQSVTSLNLSGTQVSDLSPIAGMTGMTTLSLSDTQVNDISPIAGMTGMTMLFLDNTQVSDISPIAGMTGMTALFLSATQVSDISHIAGLTGMKTLTLSDTQVSDISPIAGMQSLIDLYLDGTGVEDLRVVGQLLELGSDNVGPALTFIDCAATRVDARIKEISEIEGWNDRLFELRKYLVDWVPPGEASQSTEAQQADPFVFLSYARENHDVVGSIRDLLIAEGIPVWWDQDIPPGAQWREEVARHLDSASAVFTLWTKDSVASEAVREEASTAQAGRKLVHARLDDSNLPFGFSETNYVDLRNWDGTPSHPQLQTLIKALRHKVYGESPVRAPAPLEVEVTDTEVRSARRDGLPQSDANERAAMGWEALKEFREDFASDFNPSNYAPLPKRLAAFDRAMGDAYDPRNVVKIGVQAQRFIALAQDKPFCQNLPDGAENDMRLLAREMLVYVNRFPDWVAYRDEESETTPDDLQSSAADFQEIGRGLQETNSVARDVAEEYAAEVEQALAEGATEIDATALAASTRELSRALAERHEKNQRRVRQQRRELAKRGGEAIDGVIAPLGIPYHLMLKFEVPLTRLAEKRPERFGWIKTWYELNFGDSDEREK